MNGTSVWPKCRPIVALLALLAAPMSAAAQAQQRVASDFLVTNVRVFDGERTMPNTHVAVTGGVIRAVGGDVTPWRDLPVIDGTGSTLVPGLIDAHSHVRSAGELRQALRFGVTTVLDMGTFALTPKTLSEIRTRANAATDMADVRTAGYPATSIRGHGTQFRTYLPKVSHNTLPGEFVAMRREEGADYLKIMLNGVRSAMSSATNLDEAQVRNLVDAAHDAGMLAIAHVETLEDATRAIAGGIDGLAHVWRRGGASAEVARLLAERKVFVVPTLAVPDGFSVENRVRLLADPRFRDVLSDSMREQLGASYVSETASPGARTGNIDVMVQAVRSLHEAGVRLLVGSDPSGLTPTAQGISVHRELELLAKAGLSPSEILSAATANAADAFRLPDRGRIVEGRRADMILVRGDPTADVLAVRDIVRIWKLGTEVDRTVTGP